MYGNDLILENTSNCNGKSNIIHNRHNHINNNGNITDNNIINSMNNNKASNNKFVRVRCSSYHYR